MKTAEIYRQEGGMQSTGHSSSKSSRHEQLASDISVGLMG